VKRHLFRLLVPSLFSFLSLTCLSKSIVELEQYNLAPIDLIPRCGIFQSTEILSPQEAAQKIRQTELIRSNNTASQGFSENYFWIHFSLESNQEMQEWMLGIDNPHIDKIALYQKNDD